LENLRGLREIELIADFATPFGLAVICDFLGLARADAARLKIYSEHFFYLFSRIPSEAAHREMDRQLTAFREEVGHVVDQRRREPKDDYISRLLAAADEDEQFDRKTLIDTVILLFADAIENVDRAIASTVWLLLRDPPTYQMLVEQPTHIGSAVDEALRFESPAQIIARVAREDLEWGGKIIRADVPVLLALGAANRDPSQFSEPDRFDINRGRTAYVSFGKGKHSCIGGTLVKLEIEAALKALIVEMPLLRLLDPEPVWMARPGHRWLSHLRLRR
jgi:pimeloyl-[acyl-carrier protein] synthase